MCSTLAEIRASHQAGNASPLCSKGRWWNGAIVAWVASPKCSSCLLSGGFLVWFYLISCFNVLLRSHSLFDPSYYFSRGLLQSVWIILCCYYVHILILHICFSVCFSSFVLFRFLQGLIRFWPWSCSSKQVLFLNELEDVLELLMDEQVWNREHVQCKLAETTAPLLYDSLCLEYLCRFGGLQINIYIYILYIKRLLI